jgi:hypothetical protein
VSDRPLVHAERACREHAAREHERGEECGARPDERPVVDRLERAGFARRVRDEEDRRRVLMEVTPIVGELSREIYGSPEEALAGFASAFSDDEVEVLHRFQKLSQEWLEERLARMETLNAAKEAARDTSPSS